jgi:hypothetical protein
MKRHHGIDENGYSGHNPPFDTIDFSKKGTA